jgi:hypothetical protein
LAALEVAKGNLPTLYRCDLGNRTNLLASLFKL